MGLLLKERIAGDCILGIWNITEDYNNLYSKLNLLPEEIEILNNFKNEPRKMEWLSVRVLLREVAGKELNIIYNGNHKPLIKGNSYQISISHSHNLSAIMLSRNRRVGIDLEFISDRINSITHKFINEEELITEDQNQRNMHLYIHWCAKEALYKICDKKGIDFKTNLTIEPFLPEREGLLRGFVNTRYRKDYFNLKYFTFDNYIIVYTIK